MYVRAIRPVVFGCPHAEAFAWLNISDEAPASRSCCFSSAIRAADMHSALTHYIIRSPES